MKKSYNVLNKKKSLKTNVTCQRSNKMASCRDEELVEIVNQFPVLYDQSHSHFHRKDVKVMRSKKLQMILSLNRVSAEKLNLFVPEAAVEIFS